MALSVLLSLAKCCRASNIFAGRLENRTVTRERYKYFSVTKLTKNKEVPLRRYGDISIPFVINFGTIFIQKYLYENIYASNNVSSCLDIFHE